MSQNAKNAIFNAIGFIVPTLILFLITPYLISKLSVEVYGIYILIMSTVGLLSFMDLGFGQGVVKFVSHYYAKNDIDKINRVISVSTLINGSMGLLGAVLIYFSSSLIYKLLNINPQYKDITIISLKISSVAFFFMLLNGVLSNIFRAVSKYDIVVKVQITVYLIYNVLIVYTLHTGGNLAHITFLYSISKFVENVIFFYLCKKLINGIDFAPAWDNKIFKEISSFSIFTAINSITGNLTFRADKMILSNILGTEAVAYYNIAFMVLQAVNSFLTNVIQFLFPKVSELNSLSLKDEIRSLYLRYLNYISVLSIFMYLLLLIWADFVLNLWLGEEVAGKVVDLLPAMSLVFFLLTVSNVAYYFYNGLGLSAVNMVSSFVGTVSYLLMLFYLSKNYGLIGASFGFLFTLLPFPVYHYLISRIIGIGLSYYSKYLYKFVILIVISLCVYYVKHYFPRNLLFNILFNLLLMVAISVFVFSKIQFVRNLYMRLLNKC